MLSNQRSFPMMFIAVKGQHEHDLESPSFYNKREIDQVADVCRSLADSKLIKVSEIGVIAAFRKQVLKLRVALRSIGLAGVNVGSVEDFQGQEVKAVIISTVMTSWVKRFASKVIMVD